MLKRLNQQCRVLCVLSAGSPPVEQMVTIVQGGDQGGTGHWALDSGHGHCGMQSFVRRGHGDTATPVPGRVHVCGEVRPRAHMLAGIKLMMGE